MFLGLIYLSQEKFESQNKTLWSFELLTSFILFFFSFFLYVFTYVDAQIREFLIFSSALKNGKEIKIVLFTSVFEKRDFILFDLVLKEGKKIIN